MARFNLIFALTTFLSLSAALAQENPQQAPTVSDTTKPDATSLVKSVTSTQDSGAAHRQLQKEKVGATIPAAQDSGRRKWILGILALMVPSLLTFLLSRLPRPLFNKDERRYRKALRKELGQIKLVGPGMDDISVRLDDTFVHLRISGDYRAGAHPELAAPERMGRETDGYSPDELIRKTFIDLGCDLLLVIGDPGSGKTTLVKYYTIRALSKKGYKQLGFKKPPLPIFLPLREVKVEKTVAENLQLWGNKHHLTIKAKSFDKWLQNKQTLILLDGLDEVRDADQRRKICNWIDAACSGLENAYIVVTSRPTGYRGRDRVVLQSNLQQADIHDFTLAQREEFLRKWFAAAYLRETHLRPKDEPVREWKKAQKLIAESKTKSLLDFLTQPKNKSLRELSGIPMLLQIMAILWKKDDHLPKNRSKLYEVALDYLLEYRDAQRDLDPLLSADQAQRVLAPACLWMQEEWQHEEVQKEKLHQQIQKTLKNKNMPGAPAAKDFCENLRDRAGILADNTENEYIFRHKSFREYFAGLELAKSYNKEGRLQTLARGFFDDWWEEPLRFFISKADGEAFDNFMAALFKTTESRDLDAKLLNRLTTLVEEAPEPQIFALASALQNQQAKPAQHFAILDCLKTIGTPQALKAVENFSSNQTADADTLGRARQIIRESQAEPISLSAAKAENPFLTAQAGKTLPKSFLNPLEYNAEYLLVPGGAFQYSVTKQTERVPDLYFAKYPVTNRRYRRFIHYLREEERDLIEQIPLKLFGKKLLACAGRLDFVAGISDTDPLRGQDYRKYLGSDVKDWAEKLKSRQDDDRKFNGDDQPVVGVSWFAARAYCFWLALFEAANPEASGLQQPAENPALAGYRLPLEMEWERAAAGLSDEKGAPRKYPWGKNEPNDKLANYGNSLGATTPVGRYPAGATPEGLLDMAGNVWEWQENLFGDKDYPDARALRGGSWFYVQDVLRCVARFRYIPGDVWINDGFRPLRAQS